MLKDIEEISDASGVVADVMGDINNPEDLAKAYKAFRSLHTRLKEMSETRSKEEDDSSSGKTPSPFTIESTAEVK
jgi:hypothetical protein